MRILQLRFKNLNSLAGEWSIDFTHPAYVSSGIFAITGPTGSGKTTILDAICLALYGQTPRLKTISKSTNEIMTRNTAECFAEVVFESQVGRFVCHWSQRRAYRKPDGDLQQPRHEISDQLTGKILENKLQKVTEKVIQTTGLDYSQFTRSILLAQGDFAAFMNANADERAPILEKITGTAIYSEISKKVHERNSDEAGKRKELKDRLGNLDMLSPDKIAELRRTCEETEAEVRHLVSDQALLRQAVDWVQTISRLEQEIAGLHEQKLIFEEKRSDAESDLALLRHAKKCLPLEEVYGRLIPARSLALTYEQEMQTSRERLAIHQASHGESLKVRETARKQLDSVRTDQDEQKRVIVKVRHFDTRIGEINQQITEKKSDLKSVDDTILQLRQTISDAEKLCGEKKSGLGLAITYLKENERDTRLTEVLSGLGERMERWKRSTDSLVTNKKRRDLEKTEVSRLHENLRVQRELYAKNEHEFEKATAEWQKLQVAYDQLLDNRAPGFWSACADSLKVRRNRLESEIEIHESIEKMGMKIRELEEQHVRLVQEVGKEQDILSVLKSEHTLEEEILAKIEMNLELLNRIESLEEARSQLLDGEPCPLCGSLDHPYALGTRPCSDEAKSEREGKKQELHTLSERIHLQEKTISRMEADLHLNTELIRERKDQIRELLDASELGFDKIGFVTNSHALKDTLSGALLICDLHLAWCADICESADSRGKQLNDAKDTAAMAKESLAGVRTAWRDAEVEWNIRSKNIGELEDLVASNEEEQSKLYQNLLDELRDFGIDFETTKNTQKILNSLKKRKREFEAALTRQRDLEKEIAFISNDILNSQRQMDDCEKTAASLRRGIEDKETMHGAVSRERFEIYGAKEPDVEEQKLADILKSVEQEFQNSHNRVEECQAWIASLQEQITGTTSKLKENQTLIEDLETVFLEAIERAGFKSEEEFISARLPREQYETLERLEKELLLEERDISSRLTDRTQLLSLERSRRLTDKSSEVLSEEMSKCDVAITDLNQKLGGIGQVLQDHDGMMAQQKEIVQALEKQEIECLRWERLHDLIGSSDGKKFRVFAQGLTFDRLIAHANRHLRKMSDRYLLIRGANSSLDLDIMDNYQAGEIRSTKNLSGGESFIVSLALALGLSGMASRNVRIDSLFLDEGFGTLDNDTLEIALETLSSLQQEGKIIGVISHVPALKERISTKIVVEKITGGISRLKAPGCTFTGNS